MLYRYLKMIRISCSWVSVTTVFFTTGELTTVKAGNRPPSPPGNIISYCLVDLFFVLQNNAITRVLEQRPNPKKNKVYGTLCRSGLLTSPYVYYRIDPWALSYPMPESTLILCQNRLYLPVRDFGFGLRIWNQAVYCPEGISIMRRNI